MSIFSVKRNTGINFYLFLRLRGSFSIHPWKSDSCLFNIWSPLFLPGAWWRWVLLARPAQEQWNPRVCSLACCLSSGSIAPGAWNLETFKFIVSVWNWALLTYLVLTANTRYVLLDCNNDPLISKAGSTSLIRKSTQVSAVHFPHTCPASWMAVFKIFLLSFSGHVLQVQLKNSIIMSGGNKPFVCSGLSVPFLKCLFLMPVFSLSEPS